MIVVFLGPPGAGKGTIAQKLNEKKGFKQISTGDLVRAEIKAGTDLGQEIKETVEKGHLIDDYTIAKLFRKELESILNTDKKGIILDGYPRTVKQAELLEEILNELNAELYKAVNFELDDETIVKRLTSRYTCSDCKAIYGLDNPPKEEGICDKCKGELMQREDDKEETVRERLEVYRNNTKPLIDFYKGKELLENVNASNSIDEVVNDTEKVLGI